MGKRAATSDEGVLTTADAAPVSWPNLGYRELGALDYLVPVVDRDWFLEMASWLNSLPHQRALVLAEVLRHIADTPAALKKLNHPRFHTPAAILGLRRSLHYLVSVKLYPDKRRGEVLGIVADIWSVKDRTVEADIGNHGARARKELKWLVKHYANRSGRTKPSAKDRQHVMAALDLDLKLKATQEPLRVAHKSKVLARKK